MKTIKQVSDLTGISVRMLHHYDKIGLLPPSSFTDAGYRLYDDEALEILQQILFFRELDIPLKEMKEILKSPQYDKIQALHKQRELLSLKRDRLDELIALIDKKLKGGKTMSFKEFDMSDYFDTLESYKIEHADELVSYFGNEEKYNQMIETMKSKELELAKMAIKEYGSIDKYTEVTKTSLDNIPFIRQEIEKANEQMDRLTSDLSKSPSSPEIQDIVKEMDDLTKEDSKILKVDMRDKFWGSMADVYSSKQSNFYDEKYGKGASKFIGEAFKFYSENSK